MKLLTVLAFVLVAGAFVGCKYFRGQIVDGPGMEWTGCMPVIRTRSTTRLDTD